MQRKIKITDYRTFSEPLITCGMCDHHKCLRPGGKPMCQYWGILTEPEDFCSRAKKRECEEVSE